MGKNRKPFIDKKTASTYHLLHRSQRDVGGLLGSSDDDANAVSGTAMILWPSPHNRQDVDEVVLKAQKDESDATVGHNSALDSWKSPLEQAGIVDEYDYEQHMKTITGTGTFLGAQSTAVAGVLNARSKPMLDPTIQEVSRQLESITLTAECMDEDVVQALFDDFEEGEFEELNDDFVLMAAEEPEVEDASGGAKEEFDFDAHIRRLMEKAKASQKRDVSQVQHDWAIQDGNFFSKAKPLHEQDEEDEEYDDFSEDGLDGNLTTDFHPGMVPKLTTEEERALLEQFQQALAEYETDDDEEDYDDDNDAGPDDDARGSRPLEGDAQVEAALDDFLQERKDEVFFQGTAGRNCGVGGSGFSALVGKKIVPSQDLPNALQPADDNDAVPIQVTLESAREILAQPLFPPPPEEILIDGKSYFSERAKNPWDCESILSTYSNLDNNPITIGTTGRRLKKKKTGSVEPILPPALVKQIMLSKKTGLPLGVLQSTTVKNNKGDSVSDNHTLISINRGEARNREETVEQKKARKEAIKEERRLARLQKKTMREAFESELRKREEGAIVDSVNGQAVFRIS